MIEIQEDEDEFEGFEDFTLASPWERFVAGIEGACRLWSSQDLAALEEEAVAVRSSPGLACVHHVQGYGSMSYSLTFYFHQTKSTGKPSGAEADQSHEREGLGRLAGSAAGESWEWPVSTHHLQLWFRISNFLVLQPMSLNGVALSREEGTLLLSTLAVALSNCDSPWPGFVPVHDPSRLAYTGLQLAPGGAASRRFHADKITSRVPPDLRHLDGLYNLFTARLEAAQRPAPGSSRPATRQVCICLRTTYTVRYGFTHGPGGALGDADEDEEGLLDKEFWSDDACWDNQSAWATWHSMEDPIKGYNLTASWLRLGARSSAGMAELEKLPPASADQWRLAPIVFPREGGLEESSGFAGRIYALLGTFQAAARFQYMGDVLSGSTRLAVPPQSVLSRVRYDLFDNAPTAAPGPRRANSHMVAKAAPPGSLLSQFCLHMLRFGDCNLRCVATLWEDFVSEVRWYFDNAATLPRVAMQGPPDPSCCILQQKLELLAICIQVKRESTRARYAKRAGSARKARSMAASREQQGPPPSPPREAAESAPSQAGPPDDAGDDVSNDDREGASEDDAFESLSEDDSQWEEGRAAAAGWGDRGSGGDDAAPSGDRRGALRPVGKLMLLRVRRRLYEPATQEAAFMTEDMIEERQQALAMLNDTPLARNKKARVQGDLLASDMAAFKAANPGAVLEDFVRWHSPRDWLALGNPVVTQEKPENAGQLIQQEAAFSLSDKVRQNSEQAAGSSWSPHGGHGQPEGDNREQEKQEEEEEEEEVEEWPPCGMLSRRMQEEGNLWAELWSVADAVPAEEQRPLFDPVMEGEKVMQYLSTIRPCELLSQLLCVAFTTAAHILGQSDGADFAPVAEERHRLNALMAAWLDPGNRFWQNEGECSELLELCAALDRVEMAVVTAASLSRRLGVVPRVVAALLDLAVAGETGEVATGVALQQEQVGIPSPISEKGVVSGLFNPSTANLGVKPGRIESEKMGNRLNDHEPRLREVVLSCVEEITKLGAGWEGRMFARSTADDIQIALALSDSD